MRGLVKAATDVISRENSITKPGIVKHLHNVIASISTSFKQTYHHKYSNYPRATFIRINVVSM